MELIDNIPTYLLKRNTTSKMKDDPFRLLREQIIQRIQWMERDDTQTRCSRTNII